MLWKGSRLGTLSVLLLGTWLLLIVKAGQWPSHQLPEVVISSCGGRKTPQSFPGDAAIQLAEVKCRMNAPVSLWQTNKVSGPRDFCKSRSQAQATMKLTWSPTRSQQHKQVCVCAH